MKEKKISKKTKVKKEKKKQREIIPPTKFNPATKSFKVDFDKLKEIVKEAEESELEEQIEEAEIITPQEEVRFIAPEKTAPPILRRVESIQENLEENVASTPIMKTESSAGNTMDYAVGGDYSSSANYSVSNKKYEQERVAPMVLRDRRFDEENLQQKELLSLSDEMHVQRGWGRMKSSNVIAGDIERHGLPFEKREKKYKEFKG